jgi:hypothetical protein
MSTGNMKGAGVPVKAPQPAGGENAGAGDMGKLVEHLQKYSGYIAFLVSRGKIQDSEANSFFIAFKTSYDMVKFVNAVIITCKTDQDFRRDVSVDLLSATEMVIKINSEGSA